MEESNKLEVTEELRNETAEQRNGGDGQDVVGSVEKENVQNGGGDNGDHPSVKIKSKIGDYHVNALPFVPKRVSYCAKGEAAADSIKDSVSSPILTVPNGLTIKCNPRIWQSISARSSETETSNVGQLKPKSLFTLSGTESKTNMQSTIRQACSTPNVPRLDRADVSRDRRPSSVKFDLKQSRSYSNTVLDEGSTGESSPQFNERNAVESPSRLLSGRRNNIDFLESPRSFGPIILPNATIKVRLRNGISVDMTLDKAVCVIDSRSRITISLSCNGASAVMIHPNGKIHQIGTCVEIVAYDGTKRNNYVRYSKMWHKGISFTSESSALVYLVDSAGTRTTSDTFADMRTDYSIPVFLAGSRHGSMYIRDAVSVIGRSTYWCADDGTEEFHINDFRIIQTGDGVVNVVRSSYQWLIRTSFRNCCATLTTPQIHCTASLSETPHLFVRRQDKRVHFDGYSFVVRNASQSAGFDENNLLKVY
ncbi:hypothetical protein HA402_000060 [Bradysia odoriphaga]|nr:hypothetical protein HA402_000060 [Bradysia odoriphaga]